ncbi:formylglycine-generating enzyme family protein [Sorangium sp. So ce406]|uniref:formylglycine-generating enzyme family protein n=1 Tax=Sorangium sp. So ce406 TaxID=3133311 RepID=UPI003F5BD63F
MSGKGRSAMVWLWAAIAASCGGCAQILGADWSSYAHGEGAGGAGGPECSADEVTCSQNRPQRCVDGRWEDAPPCPAAAPVCDEGKCTTPPSCAGLAATCGPTGKESCCAIRAVPGGSFLRQTDDGMDHPATVSAFLLDRFEVTFGRFRKFVEAYPGSLPAVGAGAHPGVPGSGWGETWSIEDAELPEDAADLNSHLHCDPDFDLWTDEAGDDEQLPMLCVSWYLASAFCAWDGGRLPTEAEWYFAAAGGDEQRTFPWSDPADSTVIDDRHAVYDCTGGGAQDDSCTMSDIQPVGSRSQQGDGKWGHADLAGSMWEWALDWAGDYPEPCEDCATMEDGGSGRVIRGGTWYSDDSYLRTSHRNAYPPSVRYSHVGVRCARTP